MKNIAKFTVNYTQYLDAEGQIIDSLPAIADDTDRLISLYQTMVLNRTLDAKGIALQRTGKMGTYASTLGQEAISTAIGNVMQTDDVFVPFYRDYATMLLRNIKISEIYAYWGGDERGSCFENNAKDFPISVPIASQCLHACGAAFAMKYRKQKNIAVVTCGDGATSQGDFYEAINVAGAWELPVVFVVNNNQWAISVPRNKQTAAETLAQKAIAAGIQGEQVDGNDIIALLDVLSRACDHARQGKGPFLIEAISYRLCDHTTADDASRYRENKELELAWTKEPIKRLRNYLANCSVWNVEKEKALLEECKAQVDAAVEEYLAMGTQEISSMFEYHFENMPVALAEQQQIAMED